MSALSELRNRLRALFFGARADRASLEEFEFHLEMETEKLIAAGLPPAEARRRAAVAFGSIAATREATRDARGARVIEDALGDFAFALRQVVRRPRFFAAVVLTIALGIGAATAIWSVVDGVLLRPAPVDDLERLVVVWQTDRHSGTTREPSSWPDFEDLREQASSFAGLAALAAQQPTLVAPGGDAARLNAIRISHGYFELLGVEPLVGRPFGAAETRPGGGALAILGEDLWRGRFAADPRVVGTTVSLDGVAHEVIGVMPRSAGFGLGQMHARAAYHGPYAGGRAVDVWRPLQTDAESSPRATHPFLVLGLLRAGVDTGAAHAEAESVAARLETAYPRSNSGRGMFVEPLEDVIFAPVRPVLWLLVAAVGLLLTVAFVNVINMLLARGTARAREIALRRALGAGTARIARQLLVENGVIVALGAALGVGIAVALLRALLRMAPSHIPRLVEVGIDGRVLLLTLGIAVAGGLVLALVPTLQARRIDVLGTVHGRGTAGGRRLSRGRHALVAAEVALSAALVLAAGLLVRSLWKALDVDPGFDAAGVLKAEYQLPQSRYPRDFSRWPALDEIHDFNARLLGRVAELPGLATAALAGSHPLDAGFTNSFSVVGREDESREWPEISVRAVSSSYFETVGLALRAGRGIEPQDRTDGDTVAVINETAAARFFAGREPIGEKIRFWGTERRIVGVVEDERIHGVTEATPPALYAPLTQLPTNSGVLLVRAVSGDPMALADEVSAAIRAIDPGLAVFGVERLEETLAGSLGERRFAARVLATLAAVTLLLALIGVHGVLSYAAAQRTQEMGIRSALGATRVEIAGLVVRNGLRMAAIGVMVGLVLAVVASRLITGLLFGVTRLDPLTYALVAVTLLAAAGLASWLPARRAAQVEPLDALRAE